MKPETRPVALFEQFIDQGRPKFAAKRVKAGKSRLRTHGKPAVNVEKSSKITPDRQNSPPGKNLPASGKRGMTRVSACKDRAAAKENGTWQRYY
ncbi:hypothetical protein [Azonexus sp. R2A61]|uniref:hypothetical protein n=1 Tax=Azonexus sp. R2A61 TaxID=2744443 RepID=UPI001F25FC64|nr:hypothetical protein [Azonexus sp. R2A61]